MLWPRCPGIPVFYCTPVRKACNSAWGQRTQPCASGEILALSLITLVVTSPLWTLAFTCVNYKGNSLSPVLQISIWLKWDHAVRCTVHVQLMWTFVSSVIPSTDFECAFLIRTRSFSIFFCSVIVRGGCSVRFNKSALAGPRALWAPAFLRRNIIRTRFATSANRSKPLYLH